MPITRGGGWIRMLATKVGNGSTLSPRRSTRISRPRFQVVMRTNSPIPAITGKAPPSKIFGTLAAKNRLSTRRKPSRIGSVTSNGQRHRRSITTENSSVVISMVPVTATPYAEASAPDDLKPSTSSTTPTISAQFTAPM